MFWTTSQWRRQSCSCSDRGRREQKSNGEGKTNLTTKRMSVQPIRVALTNLKNLPIYVHIPTWQCYNLCSQVDHHSMTGLEKLFFNLFDIWDTPSVGVPCEWKWIASQDQQRLDKDLSATGSNPQIISHLFLSLPTSQHVCRFHGFSRRVTEVHGLLIGPVFM